MNQPAYSPAEQLSELLQRVRVNADGAFEGVEIPARLLKWMVGHDTTSDFDPAICKTNEPFVRGLKEVLDDLGWETRFETEEFPPGSGTRQATLVARMGPNEPGGVVLSSHTDVVAVKEADRAKWPQGDPFALFKTESKLTGRGAVDMKQALVNYLAIAQLYQGKHETLDKPVYLALSWGEEVGCKGIPTVTRLLKEMNADPEVILVGEPTNERLVTGTKGSSNFRIDIRTVGGHSSTPDLWVNAGDVMADIRHDVKQLQNNYKTDSRCHDSDFIYPYPIVNVGEGGFGHSGNSVSSGAWLRIHARSTPKVSAADINEQLQRIVEKARQRLKQENERQADIFRQNDRPVPDQSQTGIDCVQLSESVPLPKQTNEAVIEKMGAILTDMGKNAQPLTENYATDGGGLKLAFPNSTTVVYGTGNLGQGAHGNGEHITPEQLRAGPAFPLRLIAEFAANKERLQAQGGEIIPTAATALERTRQTEAKLA